MRRRPAAARCGLRRSCNVHLLLLAVAAGSAVVAAGESFADCLKVAGITTVFGDDAGYDQARRTLSGFSDAWPSAVAFPASTEQVAAAVKCAAAAGMRVHPRCGNHANEGETVATGDLTLDLRNMSSVQLSEDKGTARVGGGTIVGQLTSALWKQSKGRVLFPIGAKLSVGVSGFILGGGFGSYHRFAGLGSDQVLGATVVDAAGRVIRADADHNPELLWALRGAGGGKFGIVTEWELKTMDVSTGQTNFNWTIPPNKVLPVMEAFQTWAIASPGLFAPRGGIAKDPATGQPTWYIGGRFMGDVDATKRALVASGIEKGGAISIKDFSYSFARDPFYALAKEYEKDPTKVADVVGNRETYEDEFRLKYKYRSLILDQPLNAQALKLAMEFAQTRGTEVELKTLGGAPSAVARGASAAGHLRDGKLLFIIRGTNRATGGAAIFSDDDPRPQGRSDKPMAGGAGGGAEQSCANAEAALAEVRAGSHLATRYIKKIAATAPGQQVKAYINFRDTDVPTWADYRAAYYGSDLRGLECVKAKYDPGNVFAQPMDVVPPKDTAGCDKLLASLGASAAGFSRRLAALRGPRTVASYRADAASAAAVAAAGGAAPPPAAAPRPPRAEPAESAAAKGGAAKAPK